MLGRLTGKAEATLGDDGVWWSRDARLAGRLNADHRPTFAAWEGEPGRACVIAAARELGAEAVLPPLPPDDGAIH